MFDLTSEKNIMNILLEPETISFQNKRNIFFNMRFSIMIWMFINSNINIFHHMYQLFVYIKNVVCVLNIQSREK